MPSAPSRAAELRRRVTVLGAILRAATRVGWYEPRAGLPALARVLRDTRNGLSNVDPASILPIVEALLPMLPPWGAGRCLKRSLLLLDLWSRAGLEPALHLGYRAEAEPPIHGHAWVTTAREGLSTFQPPDVAEVWSG